MTRERVCDVLNDPERRDTVEFLRQTANRTVAFETVVDRLAEADDDRRLAIRMHHLHLPKLSEVGLVDYDPVSGRIRLVDEDDPR